MTIIATYTYKKVPLFLGDILITAGKQEMVDLPLTRDVNRVLEGKVTFRVNASKQKVNLIDDNLIAAWSGSYSQAHAILSRLDRLRQNSKLDKQQLIDFRNSVHPLQCDNVKVILGVLSSVKEYGRINSHLFRCALGRVQQLDHPLFGYVAVAGSGSSTFLKALHTHEVVLVNSKAEPPNDPDDKIILESFQFAHGLTSSFSGREVVTVV